MPLVDAGYLIPGTAFIYTAAEGTVAPAVSALAAPPVAWTLAGHLGRDDGTGMPNFERDGGDVTVKGSMSKKAIRSQTSKITRSITYSLSQFTREALGLYYGGNGAAVTGYFDVLASNDGVPTRKAVLFTFLDGTTWVGFWAGVTDTIGADALATEDVENAVLLPLRTTILDSATPLTVPKFRWIAPELLVLP
jgi:hypothetical protein